MSEKIKELAGILYEEYCKTLYEEYCKSVGGVDCDVGPPLSWKEYHEHHKQNQGKEWLDVARKAEKYFTADCNEKDET